MKNILITGISRGIGLELCNLFLLKGYKVFGGLRNPDNLNMNNENLHKIKLDITNDEQLRQLSQYFFSNDIFIDTVINNAGVSPKSLNYCFDLTKTSEFKNLDRVSVQNMLNINLTSSLILINLLLENLANNCKVIQMSSVYGSITKKMSSNNITYSISKCGLNMLTKLVANYAEKSFISTSIHPGWVKTDMGGNNADLSVISSAGKIVKLIENLTNKDNGKFYNYDGEIIKW